MLPNDNDSTPSTEAFDEFFDASDVTEFGLNLGDPEKDYSDADRVDHALEEYAEIQAELYPVRQEAKAMIQEFSKREDKLIYTKTMKNGAIVRATSEERLALYK